MKSFQEYVKSRSRHACKPIYRHADLEIYGKSGWLYASTTWRAPFASQEAYAAPYRVLIRCSQ